VRLEIEVLVLDPVGIVQLQGQAQQARAQHRVAGESLAHVLDDLGEAHRAPPGTVDGS
jgi:hypothetical protein